MTVVPAIPVRTGRARVLLPRERADMTFAALGTDVRIAMEGVGAHGRVARARELVLDHHRRLSRFRPDSELCALNADPRERVPVSPLLADAVRAALWAARASKGLVDPCLLDALEAAGYRESLAGRRPTDGRRSVFAGRRPPRATRPARPAPEARWREVRVLGRHVVRPPGLRLDLGGSGKGQVADLAAALLDGRWLVDCGGDLRVGGTWEVLVAHPWREEPAARLTVTDGAVATSSVVARAWAGGHHLLDPATGTPAHTGIVQATACAATTLGAETLAKTALLRGRDAAAATLVSRTPRPTSSGPRGLFVTDDGEVHAA